MKASSGWLGWLSPWFSSCLGYLIPGLSSWILSAVPLTALDWFSSSSCLCFAEWSSNGYGFPEYIAKIKYGCDSTPNTELSLDNSFYQLMRPFLPVLTADGNGNNGQTYTASDVIAAARDARSNPSSGASTLITGSFLLYLQTLCEHDLGRWVRKDRETPLDDEELREYILCALRPKLHMGGTMPISDGHYRKGGHPTAAILKKVERYRAGYSPVVHLDTEGERRRCYALPFRYRELLDLEAVGIHLDFDPLKD